MQPKEISSFEREQEEVKTKKKKSFTTLWLLNKIRTAENQMIFSRSLYPEPIQTHIFKRIQIKLKALIYRYVYILYYPLLGLRCTIFCYLVHF